MVLPGMRVLVSLLLVYVLGQALVQVREEEVLLVLGGTDRIHIDGSGPGL